MIVANSFSKLSDQFKHADLEESIEEGRVSFEESDDQIFIEEVIKRFLANGTISNIFRLETV